MILTVIASLSYLLSIIFLVHGKQLINIKTLSFNIVGLFYIVVSSIFLSLFLACYVKSNNKYNKILFIICLIILLFSLYLGFSKYILLFYFIFALATLIDKKKVMSYVKLISAIFTILFGLIILLQGSSAINYFLSNYFSQPLLRSIEPYIKSFVSYNLKSILEYQKDVLLKGYDTAMYYAYNYTKNTTLYFKLFSIRERLISNIEKEMEKQSETYINYTISRIKDSINYIVLSNYQQFLILFLLTIYSFLSIYVAFVQLFFNIFLYIFRQTSKR